MPRFSAPAALALLQQSGIDLPFIIVSGTIGEDVAVEALRVPNGYPPEPGVAAP